MAQAGATDGANGISRHSQFLLGICSALIVQLFLAFGYLQFRNNETQASDIALLEAASSRLREDVAAIRAHVASLPAIHSQLNAIQAHLDPGG